MSNKFTGITSAGSAIPVYDKDAHSALEQKLDTSAFSSVSGDFLTEVPESAVSGFATHEEVNEATSGKMDLSGLASGSVTAQYYPYTTTLYSAYNGIPFYAAYTSGDKLDKSAALAVSPNFNRNTSQNDGYAKFSGWAENAGIDISGAHTNKRIYITDEGITLSGYSSQSDADRNINGHYLNITPENYVDKTKFKNIVAGDNQIFVPNDVKTVSGNYDTQYSNYSFIGDFSGNDNLSREFTVTLPVATTSVRYTACEQDWNWLYYGTLTSEDPKTVWKIRPDRDYIDKKQDYEIETATFYTFQITQSPFPSTGGVVSASLVTWNDEVFATRPWVEEQLSANVPQGVMQTSGLEYDGDKISGYMGSAFKAGDELPSGVMNTSALEYNAVNEISGYNGSAIAQYGAEKQWLQHDDTLVHAANSAQYALGVNLSAVAQLLGVDETVLWETPVENTPVATAALSESLSAFNSFKVHLTNGTSIESRQIHYLRPESTMWNVVQGYTEQGSNPAYLVMLRLGTNESKTEISAYTRKMISFGNWDSTSTGGQSNTNNPAVLLKIVGIGRKEV